MKPIAFRCTSESTTHDEEFFWVSWKIKANELGKCVRGVEVDWIEVQSEDFAPLTITRKELSLGFPSDYTLPCLPTSAVKTRPKELESMRWSILASTGHPKHAAALVKSWLVKVGIITEDTEFTNENSQVDKKEHGVDMVKELVRRQTHKGREVRRFGPYEHPGFLPRSSIDPRWWHWRRVFGAPWKNATEHINALELRALMAAVQWRLRVPANVHSKGLHISDSCVIFGSSI